MFNQVKCETPDLAKQNLEKLKALFPGVVTEGPDGVAIDVEALKQECSATPIEGNVERYEFTWPGKRAAKAAASTATNKTLRPCRAESVNFDTTENLYIEGDNLEVLKLLQTNYAGKVKMIYIDPPYNTGHDFVYRDRFSLTQKELESDAGAFDDDGNRFEVNDSSEARYHSNWCSMMYPRLKLARQLLRDDGVLFMSIDDNEVTNARKLCDEVFGEQGFLACVIWERAYAPVNLKKHFSESHDFLLAYCKNAELCVCNGLKRSAEANERYSNPDSDPRGVWKAADCTVGPEVPEKVYPITLPSGRVVYPSSGRCWLYTKERFAEMVKEKRISFGPKGDSVPAVKKFLSEVKQGMTPMTIWKYTEVGHSQDAAKRLMKLFDGKAYFDYPKPVELIRRSIELYGCQNCIVLDFFSGSATTAHAVMQLNAEDGGNRKFIMVQLPETCAEDSEAAKAGYKNICEIGKERIRRAGKKIEEEVKSKSEKVKSEADLFTQDQRGAAGVRALPDVGFRVLKLDSSSLEDASETASGTKQQMLGLSRIKEDRTSEDLLFQILLESKLSLSDRIEKKKVEGNEVFFVSDTALVACLDAKAKMTEKFFTALAKFQPALAFFRDDLFESDSARINLAQIFKQFSPNTTITVI